MIENERYIDIDFDFKAHPVSGDLVLKKKYKLTMNDIPNPDVGFCDPVPY